MEDKDELVFIVKKDIWLAIDKPFDEPNSNIIGWTDTKPKYDNGHVEQGTILTFDHMYEDALVFVLTDTKLEEGSNFAEFLQEELIRLNKSDAIALLESSEGWKRIFDITTSKPSSVDTQSAQKDEYYPISVEQFETFANSISSKYVDNSILPSCDYIIDRRDTIEFPFSIDYKNEWSIWEGIREIIQNSMDTETRLDIYTPNNNTIVIHDEGKGLSIKDFRLGGGEKARLEESKKYIKECDAKKLIRGAHGEGMKLTFLVLSKNPEIYKFYHYSRCIRATAEFVTSQRFKELTLNVYLDPIQPHRGTTFILNAPSRIIQELIQYCKTRFIYHNLYINGEKSKHVSYEMLSKGDRDITIGHVVDMLLYDSIEKEGNIESFVDKPLYIRGIYVKDLKTVFSYDFICPYLDSARNIVDISQIKDQIKRVYTNLEFKGISALTIAERFVRAMYLDKDIDFVENNVYFYSYEVKTDAKRIYRQVWDIIFGKNAFIETDKTLTQLAEEQIYVERDDTGNIIREVHYKPIELSPILERIFFAADVPKDSDIIVQQTIDIPISKEDLGKDRNLLMKNLRDAISVLCPIYDLNVEEEIAKWDVFLIEYKSENQPPKNLWKSWDDISLDTKITTFHEILMLYHEFYSYPIIIERGLKLPIIELQYYVDTTEKILNLDKSKIISDYQYFVKYMEKFENRIIPVKQKLGYYNHHTERFGIRYDCLAERDKTFTVVIHEYAHKEKEVDDIDDYDSAMGKILNVIQHGYGKILNDSLIYADQIYEHYILKTMFDNITNSDVSEKTRENLLNSLKILPDNISDVIFSACTDKKIGKYNIGKESLGEKEKELYLSQIEQPTEEDFDKTTHDTPQDIEKRKEWENTANTLLGDYIESTGFTRTEQNIDHMLKNYKWDARNKTIIENIEFDAHNEGMNKDIHVTRIEHLIEPIMTNITKKLFPDSNVNRYHWVAHTNSDDIIAFNLKDDGKYPNIPWQMRIFKLITPKFV